MNSLDEAVRDPQVRARDMVVQVEHPEGGSFEAIGNPFKLSSGSDETFTAPPLLGQHSREILIEVLGYDTARAEALLEEGAVAGLTLDT